MSPVCPFLTDDEIREIVKPLVQPAAIVRWFRSNGFDKLRVKPNGMPLISRAYFDEVTAGAAATTTSSKSEVVPQPNVAAYLARIGPEAKAARKAQRTADREAQKLGRH